MNKYEATLRTFCDACFSQKSCKGDCRRMSEMTKFINKYEHLAQAYDKACYELSLTVDGLDKDIIKEQFLNGK